MRANIEFAATMQHPTVGISVENEEHRCVFMANSIWQSERTGVFEAGEHMTISVRFRNLLGPGRYFLSPAGATRGGLEIADHRPRALSYVTTGTRTTGALVDLDHELRVERGSATPPLAEIAT